MPLELLAEILSYPRSPRDILALARTSKHFCAVLINNRPTDFIWRQARARAKPSRIPEFTPNFTEASYAAFLFDNKLCEVCLTKTKEMYHSFALRGAVCDKTRCLVSWRQQALRRVTTRDEVEYPEFLHWIPRMERTDGIYESKVYVRKSDWQEAINEYKKVHLLGGAALEAYVRKTQALADALPAKVEFCKRLLEWSTVYELIRKQTLTLNNDKAQAFATANSWPLHDFLRTPSYSAVHHAKNRSLTVVTQKDFDEVKVLIPGEIAVNKERGARRQRENELRDRLDEIKTTWGDLKASSSSGVQDLPKKSALPAVNEFRKLSVVKIYEKEGPVGQPRKLDDPFVASVLSENLEQWRETARAALAAVLGFPGWKMQSKKKLHPVDRLSARFRCERCDKVAAENKVVLDDGGMDFGEACGHLCGHLKKKKRNKERWSAERFVPDQQAIDAISQVLELCGASSADADSIRLAEEAKDRVQCQSCSCVMDVQSVARHCKRHTDCMFILLPLPRPIEYGLTKKLMKSGAEAAQLRDLRVYGCWHCSDSAPGAVMEPKSSPRMFTFNGLRSHVKEKHSVKSIADEDFYRQKDTAATDTSAANDNA